MNEWIRVTEEAWDSGGRLRTLRRGNFHLGRMEGWDSRATERNLGMQLKQAPTAKQSQRGGSLGPDELLYKKGLKEP